MNKDALAKMIDHTNLKPYVSNDDIEKLCKEAIDYKFAMVAVNSVQSKKCRALLDGSGVHVGAAISFPLGQTTIENKKFETKDAIYNGAQEIDYVINITELKNKNYIYIANEMKEIVDICKSNNVISKVIFENCYLQPYEIAKLCEISLSIKPDFIKTSTGFGTYGARIEDVELMKSIVKDKIAIKAAGGIKTYEQAIKFIELGVKRIGTSSGVKIIEEYLNNEN